MLRPQQLLESKMGESADEDFKCNALVYLGAACQESKRQRALPTKRPD